MGKPILVIPHMESIPRAKESLASLLRSLEEEIPFRACIVTNEGLGYGAAVNMGLAIAFNDPETDHVIVANNDIRLLHGRLSSLMKLHSIVTPAILPEPRDNMPRCCFSVCRSVYNLLMEKDGFFYDPIFSEDGGYYWEDDDLILRLKIYEVPIVYEPDVLIEHYGGGGMTAKQLGESYWFETNKKKFDEKWNGKH